MNSSSIGDTRSRAIGSNPFEGRSMSVRTEETSFLPTDKVWRCSLDDIVMVDEDAEAKAAVQSFCA